MKRGQSQKIEEKIAKKDKKVNQTKVQQPLKIQPSKTFTFASNSKKVKRKPCANMNFTYCNR